MGCTRPGGSISAVRKVSGRSIASSKNGAWQKAVRGFAVKKAKRSEREKAAVPVTRPAAMTISHNAVA